MVSLSSETKGKGKDLVGDAAKVAQKLINPFEGRNSSRNFVFNVCMLVINGLHVMLVTWANLKSQGSRLCMAPIATDERVSLWHYLCLRVFLMFVFLGVLRVTLMLCLDQMTKWGVLAFGNLIIMISRRVMRASLRKFLIQNSVLLAQWAIGERTIMRKPTGFFGNHSLLVREAAAKGRLFALGFIRP
ncbi:hypothetical protein OIU85_017817 [Salix viminalis]|uniref:Uncharacterized protein n=1 Tax=Salix viminalis TaxID=40686 RepID=A0A9Q0SAA7_SALVM|nr:hypothetical protein OIU85_017817 [Salix viminalis]